MKICLYCWFSFISNITPVWDIRVTYNYEDWQIQVESFSRKIQFKISVWWPNIESKKLESKNLEKKSRKIKSRKRKISKSSNLEKTSISKEKKSKKKNLEIWNLEKIVISKRKFRKQLKKNWKG
jgi:hypothetical protein